jgi:hypothetical protein
MERYQQFLNPLLFHHLGDRTGLSRMLEIILSRIKVMQRDVDLFF